MKLKALGSSNKAKKAEAAEKAKALSETVNVDEQKDKPEISPPVPSKEIVEKEVVKNAVVPLPAATSAQGPVPLPPLPPAKPGALPPPTVARNILSKAMDAKKRKELEKKEAKANKAIEAAAKEMESVKAAVPTELSQHAVGEVSQKAASSVLEEVSEMTVGDLAQKAAGAVLKGTIVVAQHSVDAAAHVAVEKGLVSQEDLGHTVTARQATAQGAAETEVIPRTYTLTNMNNLSFGEGITVPDKRPYIVTRSLAQGLTGKLFTFTHKAIWGCSTNLPLEGPLRLLGKVMGKCWSTGNQLPVDHLAFVAWGEGKVAGNKREVYFVAQFGSPDIWGVKDEIPFRALLKEGKKKYAVMAIIQGPGNMDVWIVQPATLRKRYVYRDQRLVIIVFSVCTI